MQVEYLLGREIVPVCAPSLLQRLSRPCELLKEVLLRHTNFPENWALWAKSAGLRASPALGLGYVLSINSIFAARLLR